MDRNEKLEKIFTLMAGQTDFSKARDIAKNVGLKPTTVVPSYLIKLGLRAKYATYNPKDYGMNGKISEAERRLSLQAENGRTWFYWKEFSARPAKNRDLGNKVNCEYKSSFGSWLYSFKYDNWDAIMDEYLKKDIAEIEWNTEYFTIRTSWKNFLEYLASYNSKGLATWFRSEVNYSECAQKYYISIQNIWTAEKIMSKKKLAYLLACPYRVD